MSTSQKRGYDQEKDSDEPDSLSRPISPPTKKRRQVERIPSPWQLTWIRDLPGDLNQDASTLKDLLGDPLIAECWEFNYLHSIPFLMDAFDPDVRHMVQVHVIHGFWKHEDPNRLQLTEEAQGYKNVTLHAAPMPEMFGTHHSKMMILFRHDDTAQVIIHTANMIPKDWTNMTNAIWKSPLLSLSSSSTGVPSSPQDFPVGSGERFKIDLLNYLRRYDSRRITCKALSDKLAQYEFSEIRAALVASVPGKHDVNDLSETPWGWPALKKYTRQISCQQGDSEVVVQVSSIATLGSKDDWLQKTLFESLSGAKPSSAARPRPRFKVVFPTADEIRRSLDGYSSGGSIHTKIQSQQQTKQLEYLRPIFHHWANDSNEGVELPQGAVRKQAGRKRAAPHIKTYIRYNGTSIDWAMLTSANLSKQAWGETAQAGQNRIASWEIGVLLWPELLKQDSVMVGTFRTDIPDEPEPQQDDDKRQQSVIGLRMPYDLPLQRYARNEMPWVATMVHQEADWMGNTWGE